MTSLLTYSLAVSVLMLILAPVTQLVVSRNSFHRFNRFVLLSTMALCVALPVIIHLLRSSVPSSVTELQITLNDVTIIDNVSRRVSGNIAGFNPVNVATYIYYIGISLFALYELSAWIRLRRLIGQCRKMTYGKHTLCIHDNQDLAPFSCMGHIVISDADYQSDSAPILLHESAHLAKRHWLDLLLMDIVTIFLWYNPIAWLLRDRLRQIHEYEADKSVIDQGISVIDYQKLLINTAIDRKIIRLTNSFASNGSNFRRRVLMIGSPVQNTKRKYLALLLVPTCIIAAAAVNNNITAEILSSISGERLNNISTAEPEPNDAPAVTEPIADTDDVIQLPSPNIDQKPLASYICSVMYDGEFGGDPMKFLIKFTVDKDGKVSDVVTSPDSDNEIVLAVKESLHKVEFTTKYNNGDKPVNMTFTLPVTYNLDSKDKK